MLSACRSDFTTSSDRLRDSTADAQRMHLRTETALQDIALAGRVRYHANVYWEKAPDFRTSRTLDWLNDACEAKLTKEDRDRGAVKYSALMAPTKIAFILRDSSLSFDWKHPFTQANRAKLRLGKGHYIREFPISLLLTTELNKTDADGKDRKVQPYVLLGTKKRLGRRPAVKKYERADIRCGPVRRVTDISRDPIRPVVHRFQCILYISTVAIDVRFATESEATVLFQCLKPKPERKPAAAKSSV
jgi:hypothetical protein